MSKLIKLSVHQLVDFLLRRGDIDNRVFNTTTMQEGSKIHALYQAKQSDDYLREHYLCETFSQDEYSVVLNGRADGIILKKVPIIDEIKSTIDDLDNFHNNQEEWHLGQAKCYALMFAHEQHLDKIQIRLTYISQITKKKIKFEYEFLTKELEEYICDLIHRYLNFQRLLDNLEEKRNASCKNLKFPYKEFRTQQKKLSKYAYSIAKNGGVLYCEAPTGTGKTISTLFPYVKSFYDTDNEKIFYLTAKTSGRDSAFKAILDMKANGLDVREIAISAREKVCLSLDAECNPDSCVYARRYYDKIVDVITKTLQTEDDFTAERIKEIAFENSICPFEFQLDLSLYVDIIICDYNYMFDPVVKMKRFFDEDCTRYIALIDEAHNLVERSRTMYSTTIDFKYFHEVKEHFKIFDFKVLNSAFRKFTKFENELNDKIGEGPDEIIVDYSTLEQFNAIENLSLAMQKFNKEMHKYVNEDFHELSLELHKFLTIFEYFDDAFVLYIDNNHYHIQLKLFCLDASKKVKESLSLIKSNVIFSATLSPSEYYVNMLGGNYTSPLLALNSPFNKKHMKSIVVPNISTKYSKRDKTYPKIANYIETFIHSKLGNYFIYLPSYDYLEKILPYLDLDGINAIVQSKDMSEEEKELFLTNFKENPKKTTVGFVILGGRFSEGIDLVSDRLIGVLIVGVGLPQICFERNLIKEYFDSIEMNGFDYSYVNPGINRVLQAAGRIIRSEDDRGVAIFIDDRYLNKKYLPIFENKLTNYEVAFSEDEVVKILNDFWSK